MASNTLMGDQVALNHLRRFAREDAASGARGDELRTHQLGEEFFARLFNLLLAEGYAVSSVWQYRAHFSAFLAWLGHGKPNGATACRLPRQQEEEVRTWTDTEIEAIRDAARWCDGRHRDFGNHLRAVDWALICGGRRQELFASEYGYIRPLADEYTFKFQAARVNGATTLAKLKGRIGRTGLLLPVGGKWMERVDPNGTGFILAGPDGGLVHPHLAVEIGYRIFDKAELHFPGIGWHSFRHTFALHFLLYGGTLEGLQETLGHATIKTTQRFYKHMRESAAAQRDRAQMLRFQGSPAVRIA